MIRNSANDKQISDCLDRISRLERENRSLRVIAQELARELNKNGVDPVNLVQARLIGPKFYNLKCWWCKDPTDRYDVHPTRQVYCSHDCALEYSSNHD